MPVSFFDLGCPDSIRKGHKPLNPKPKALNPTYKYLFLWGYTRRPRVETRQVAHAQMARRRRFDCLGSKV